MVSLTMWGYVYDNLMTRMMNKVKNDLNTCTWSASEMKI